MKFPTLAKAKADIRLPEYLDGNSVKMNGDIEKAMLVVRRILSSSDTEFHSRSFILDQVRQYGLFFSGWSLLSKFVEWQNCSQFGLLQYPTEFADFAMEVAKLNIDDAIEIGVYYGASSFFLAAMLQRANKKSTYHMVDIADRIPAINEFKSLLNLEVHIPATSDDFKGKEFDFVFIDADHSYEATLRDYLNLGQFAKKAVAFHDICGHEYDHLSGGTVRFWKDFRDSNATEMRIVQFTHSPTEWMGIGLGVKEV
ncbi:MAG: class I SAM-dependent methyltransferase [Rhizobiales bacterium]|nr:class I SAM-dependent methyltransferase [Hyphomicrobiales bacterium]